MKIRRYKIGEEQQLWTLLYKTIHKVNIKDYSPAQVEAWAPTNPDIDKWNQRLKGSNPFIAEENGAIVGFAELEDNGHIGCFYCAYNWQGKGVGSSLLQALELEASKHGITKLFTEANITAKEFFIHKGFFVERRQCVTLREEKFTNYAMSKHLNLKVLKDL